MKRPILVITLGYIIGIIMGLYFDKSMVLIYVLIIGILSTILFICSRNRYFRYVKLYLKLSTIILILIAFFFGLLYVRNKKDEYVDIYTYMESCESIKLKGKIVSNKEERKYKDVYKIKIDSTKKLKGKTFYCYINKKIKNEIEYGDYVEIEGKFQRPSTQRNSKGFDYSNYLKTKNIYGTINISDIKVEEKINKHSIFKYINMFKLKIKDASGQIEGKDRQGIFLGLILGDTSNIEEDLMEDFRTASLAHVLAVSGMHISYLSIGSLILFKNLFGKRKSYIISSIIIILYIMLTGFASSAMRAGIVSITMMLANFSYKKNDIVTSISLSLLIILIQNPFLIWNAGLQLSYIGTIGIIVLQPILLKKLKKIKIKDRRIKYRIPKVIIHVLEKAEEIISIIISAQIMIIPISIFHFNLLSSYFIITNFLISIIIGPIFIIGIIYTVSIFINSEISLLIAKILQLGIGIIIKISKIPQNLMGGKTYIPTPKIWQIACYYFLVIVIAYVNLIQNKQVKNMTQQRILNLIALAKFKYRNRISKKKKILVYSILQLILCLILVIPNELEVNFIDVGQGDSTFIITPSKKTILIDGGGSINSEFDVGKSTLLPYILDKGFNKIDYVMISHFDQDHVGGIITILENLKVGQVIISKQAEKTDNYERFLKIVKEKKIDVKVVKRGESLNIDKNINLKIIWPNQEPISENMLNNNAIVAKLLYNEFSCLFTGDIEQIAEEEIIKVLDKEKINSLESTVLKVAHHGSKTSSTQEFLNKVKPKIALVGVGENNIFGHPNENVLERLTKLDCKIFRTDKNGEINLRIKKNGKFKVMNKISNFVNNNNN